MKHCSTLLTEIKQYNNGKERKCVPQKLRYYFWERQVEIFPGTEFQSPLISEWYIIYKLI